MGIMGSTRSKNYLDNVTETVTQILQENSQQCKVNATQVQQLVASGNCTINLKNVDFEQLIGVDFDCIQSAELNAKVASQMQVELEQLAKSLVSGLRFDIASSQSAENFIINHVKLATAIINRITQSCGIDAGQYQGFECKDNANILVTDTSYKQTITGLFKCAQKGETVADVKTDIEQFIKQTAISENKGLSFDLLLIAAIIVVVVVVILIINKGLDWKFLAIGLPILAIIIYLIVANKKNWWPFKSKFDEKSKNEAKLVADEPEIVKKYKAEQAVLQNQQAWGRAELQLGAPCGKLNKTNLTPSQYRALKYGDDSIAFERPYDKRKCKESVMVLASGAKTKVKPVRLNMKPFRPFGLTQAPIPV